MLWAPWTDNKRNENMLKQMNSQQEWRTRIRKQIETNELTTRMAYPY